MKCKNITSRLFQVFAIVQVVLWPLCTDAASYTLYYSESVGGMGSTPEYRAWVTEIDPLSYSGTVTVPNSYKKVNMTYKVLGINSGAFNGCSLSKLYISGSCYYVHYLGTCKSLKKIVIRNKYCGSDVESDAFTGTHADCLVYVPKGFKVGSVTLNPGDKLGGRPIDYYRYWVKFNANGGTGSMSNQKIYTDESTALTANAFTRSGYTFSGWATSASGAKAYSDKQKVTNLSTEINATVTLYAVWTALPSLPENSITASGYSGKYDGEEHKISVVLDEAISDATVKYSTSENGEYSADCPTMTDAGTYTTWYEVSKSGYASQKGSATVTISKREVTLTSGSANKVYDGEALVKHEMSAIDGDGFLAGEGATYTYTGSQTMVGTSPNTFTYEFNDGTKAANYAITMVNGTLEVTKPAASGFYIYSVKQRYPWNGLVDFSFVFSGMAGMKYDIAFSAKDMTVGTNITMATVYKEDGSVANMEKEQLTPGTYNWVWNAAADLPKDFKCDRVTVTGIADVSPFPYSVKFNANGGTGTMANESFTYGTAKALTANAFTRTGYTFQGWATSANGAKAYSDKQSVSNLATSSGEVVNLYALWKAALYMVVDLSSGSNSSSYPISYLDAVPNGGWSDTYKTTKLVLRRIEPGTFKMQNTSNVTLTKPFYIGVFEVTQRQYSLIVGTNPVPSNNKWCYGEICPVFFVSYNDIRGASTGSGWPTSNGVDDNSFLGKLRVRTQFSFDLPTEAQWEYASRAGSNSAYYWGETMDSSYCWWNDNCSRAQNVGLKNPNYWGLYDTAGNAWEFCLDWYGNLSYGTDPKGSSSNSMGRRVKRGGDWQTSDEDCFKPISSYSRWYDSATWSGDDDGFRICLTLQ